MGAEEKLRIVIDTREKVGWTFEPAQVEVVRRKLDAGDYSVQGLENQVALERKNLGDLVQTITHDWLRFRKELIRLSGYSVAAICVEADIGQLLRHEYESEALPASVLGRIDSILIDHNIATLWWGDRRTASDRAHRLLLLAWRKLAHEIDS